MNYQTIQQSFPDLLTDGFLITSPNSRNYNCIAWAAGETDRWWWPDSLNIGYWPPGLPRIETLDTFIEAFQTQDYIICSDSECESGFEKIAIYAKPDGKPTHTARQLNSGRWTSKLGDKEDIEHNLDGLVGAVYGTVAVIMKKPV